eukprot:3112655-Pyramimonas_sp.AAC.1
MKRRDVATWSIQLRDWRLARLGQLVDLARESSMVMTHQSVIREQASAAAGLMRYRGRWAKQMAGKTGKMLRSAC